MPMQFRPRNTLSNSFSLHGVGKLIDSMSVTSGMSRRIIQRILRSLLTPWLACSVICALPSGVLCVRDCHSNHYRGGPRGLPAGSSSSASPIHQSASQQIARSSQSCIASLLGVAVTCSCPLRLFADRSTRRLGGRRRCQDIQVGPPNRKTHHPLHDCRPRPDAKLLLEAQATRVV